MLVLLYQFNVPNIVVVTAFSSILLLHSTITIVVNI